jgi:hypothetical protein
MKRIQSVVCAAALALALSTTVLAGDIHGVTATAPGDIHGKPANGNITTLLTDVFVAILVNIHG